MEIRDLVQAIMGALVLKPDGVLVASALNNSFALSQFIGAGGLSGSYVAALGIIHVLLLILGVGLLIGVGPVTSIAIALLVVLGVAGGLFAIGQFMEVIGPQFASLSGSMNDVLGSLVVQPYVADVYIFAPILILAAGIFRWRHATKIRKQRTVNATQASLRQHCTFCGARIETTAAKCKACGRSVSTKMESFCIECGKPLPEDAVYCGYCGAEILRGEEAKCQNCEKMVPGSSKYCSYCGARLRPGREEKERGYAGGGNGS
ncbi:MAG: zinc ribbon domain-containing protein [Thaumarchaeota archaeon]|nr:zinc ribbon domain-containing protein [Nitrososphaerota archaeon]